MGEAFIVRRGGGSQLNFRVIGGTVQPTSAKENDIWVNTDADITGWAISAEQPTSLGEGGDTVTWDGNVEGETPLASGDGYEMYLVKISDAIPSKDDLLNGYTIKKSDGTINTVSTSEASSTVVEDGGGLTVSDVVVVIPAGQDGFGAGIYVMHSVIDSPLAENVWISEFTINGYSGFASIPEGTVWVETALESAVQFNTLKKNALLVYPKSVKQYVDGEWESMDAYVYQDNAWVQFSSDFPEYWFHYAGHGWNQEMGAYKQWGSVGTVGTDEISIPVQTANYGQDGVKVGIYQETAFDFTNFQKLKFEYKGDIYSSSNEGVFVGIGNTSGDWPASNWDAQMIFRQAVADWTAYEIDISAVNKSSRLRLMVWATKGSSAHIRNITLE